MSWTTDSTLPAIGCAGWSLPRASQDQFPGPDAGTHLQRYAARLPAVEINSSFYRPHKPATYARWAAGVPDGFRFSVKLPKAITHQRRLVDCGDLLKAFLDETAGLGEKLGCLLVQLPPSLALDTRVAKEFFKALRILYSGPVAFEPRHTTWFGDEGEQLLQDHNIARVAADPPRAPADGEPGGDTTLVYYRLHGAPRIYYSDYESGFLDTLTTKLESWLKQGSSVWCVFDNTAAGCATGNALDVLERLKKPGTPETADRQSTQAPTARRGRRMQHDAMSIPVATRSTS